MENWANSKIAVSTSVTNIAVVYDEMKAASGYGGMPASGPIRMKQRADVPNTRSKASRFCALLGGRLKRMTQTCGVSDGSNSRRQCDTTQLPSACAATS